jgi:hypothetical protein
VIGLYDDSGNRLAVTFPGITLNAPADPADDTFELNSVVTLQPTDGPLEQRPADDGSEVHGLRKQMSIVRLDGTIRAPSLAKLYDKKRLLASAFDPARAAHEDTTDGTGLQALDFSVPTTDTDTWPTGFVPSRYYARSRQVPIPADSQTTGNACFFSVELVVPDARRCSQAEATLSGAGTATNEGDYRAWPTLTITMAGAGSATYAVTNNPDLSGIASSTLTLDLSGCSAADVVEVDMQSRTTPKNGTDSTDELYVSGDYFEVEPGANVLSYANTTNATSVLGWRHAWSA